MRLKANASNTDKATVATTANDAHVVIGAWASRLATGMTLRCEQPSCQRLAGTRHPRDGHLFHLFNLGQTHVFSCACRVIGSLVFRDVGRG
jgi:hypothetical protein